MNDSSQRLGMTETIIAATDVQERLPKKNVLLWTDFVLEDCLSSGQFSAVYRGALVCQGGRSMRRRGIVVKTKGSSSEESPTDAADLLMEITMCSTLRHPCIVPFVGACFQPGRFALVTELAMGGNLHHLIHVQRKRLHRKDQFRLAKEMMEALSYLHSRKPAIVHADVKSMNFVLDQNQEHLQLCDFGLARRLESSSSSSGSYGTKRDPRSGSPRYMAPERHDIKLGASTERIDIWAAGCVLIEIFGQVVPFDCCTNSQQITRIIVVERRGPTVPMHVEMSVQGIILCALAYKAEQRPTAQQLLLHLETQERLP